MVQSCIRLSNDAKFFTSSDKVNENNTYSEILRNGMNISMDIGHNIGKTMQSVVIGPMSRFSTS